MIGKELPARPILETQGADQGGKVAERSCLLADLPLILIAWHTGMKIRVLGGTSMDSRSDDFPRLASTRFPKSMAFSITVAAVLISISSQAQAILIIGPNDSHGNPIGGQNTSAPTGALANSGWQFEGLWQGAFTGTPIAPNYFLSANHLGGNVGDTFAINGQSYTTTAKFLDPSGGDLALWQVNSTFASYAPLYTGNEVGQTMITFGRGGPPGPSTTTDGVALSGWIWTSPLGGLSWGTNQVTSAGTIQGGPSGQYVFWAFDKTLGPNTGSLSPGDSGGGVFINVGGVWKLAGINFEATGPYNTHPGNAPATSFTASLYDSRGLYFDGDTTPITGSVPVPSIDVASRISTEAAWISGITGVAVPEPGSVVLLSAGLVLALPLCRKSR